jgi:hypothetical protein
MTFRSARIWSTLAASIILALSVWIAPAQSQNHLVDVEADCQGNVTFTNLLEFDEVHIVYGGSGTFEDGELHIPPEESRTLTTDRDVLYYQVSETSESGSIEIPTCSDGDGNGDDDGDDDNDGDGDGDNDNDNNGVLANTGV